MQHVVDAHVARLKAAEAALVGRVDDGADGELANVASPDACGAMAGEWQGPPRGLAERSRSLAERRGRL